MIASYLDQIARDVGECGQQLMAKLEPVIIEWAKGTCDLAVNRDLFVQGENRYVVGANVDVPADNYLIVGRICGSKSGRVIAVLANYAIHLTSLGGLNALISPDLLGQAREIVEEEFDAPFVFLAGAAGELAPLYQYSGDPRVADKNGKVLGHAVLSVLCNMPSAGMRARYTKTLESGAPLGIFEDKKVTASQVAQVCTLMLDFPTKDNTPPGGGGGAD